MSQKCEICNQELPYGRKRFCSMDCYNQRRSGKNNPNWKGGNVIQVCEWCGKEFEVVPIVASKGLGRFCSYVCHGKWKAEYLSGENHPCWKGGDEARICEYCGSIFRTNPGREKRFCSQSCMGQWYAKTGHGRGENNGQWQGGLVQRVCLQCEKEFEVRPSQIARGKGKFCSYACMGRWRSENLNGENHPNWKGGISFEPYGTEFNDALKKKIRDRDCYACAICKVMEKKITHDVHHIDYDKQNSSLYNLITLCHSCHARTNFNRKYWREALSHLPLLHKNNLHILKGATAS